MSEVNMYSPPRAHVADVAVASAQFQAINFWSAKGRIGRLRFLAYGTAGYLLFALAAGVAGAVGAIVHPMVATIGIGVTAWVYVVFACLMAIQRSHDMGWSGWTMPLMLVPVVGLLWIFKSGSEGANRYGAPPPPNTWGVRILGVFMPLVAVVGILAAIALPAYQHYQVRAKAAQVGR